MTERREHVCVCVHAYGLCTTTPTPPLIVNFRTETPLPEGRCWNHFCPVTAFLFWRCWIQTPVQKLH
jgi:hypothetical protein